MLQRLLAGCSPGRVGPWISEKRWARTGKGGWKKQLKDDCYFELLKELHLRMWLVVHFQLPHSEAWEGQKILMPKIGIEFQHKTYASIISFFAKSEFTEIPFPSWCSLCQTLWFGSCLICERNYRERWWERHSRRYCCLLSPLTGSLEFDASPPEYMQPIPYLTDIAKTLLWYGLAPHTQRGHNTAIRSYEFFCTSPDTCDLPQ